MSGCLDFRNLSELEEHLFKLSLDMVAIAGFDGYIQYANPTVIRTLGYSIDELKQVLYIEFVHQEDREAMLREINRLLSGQATLNYEVRLRRRDGSYLWTAWNTVSLPEEKIIYGTGRDISSQRKSEKTLYQSEQRFHSLIQSVPEYAIFMLDKTGNIVSWNKGAERIKGYRENEVLGKNFSIFYTNEDQRLKKPRVNLEEASTKGSIKEQGWRIRKDGSRFWAEVLISAIRNENGGLEGFSKITRDLTEQKRVNEQLQQSEAHLRLVVQSVNEAIVVADSNGNIIQWNKGAESRFGYSPEEAIGKPLTLLMPERYRESHLKGLARLHQGGESHVIGKTLQLHGRRRSGEEFPLELRISMFTKEQEQYFVGVIRDITEQKKADEIKIQAEALSRSNKELEQFAYVVSHDLQEPLRTIVSYVQLLEQRYKAKIDEKAERLIFRAVEGGKRMQRLINDLLTYSRVNWQLNETEPVDSAVILAQVLRNLRAIIHETHAVITYDPLPVVAGSPIHMIQLFQNLIGNSLKFHRPDSPPTIHISARKSGQECIFSFADQGIGIQPEFRDRVFRIFQRLNTRQEFEGTGIGLAICKRVVEQLRGRIWLESEPGKGSTFLFTIPMKGAEES